MPETTGRVLLAPQLRDYKLCLVLDSDPERCVSAALDAPALEALGTLCFEAAKSLRGLGHPGAGRFVESRHGPGPT